MGPEKIAPAINVTEEVQESSLTSFFTTYNRRKSSPGTISTFGLAKKFTSADSLNSQNNLLKPMAKPIIFVLKMSWFLRFLSEWLDLRDIAALDSAVTNHTYRSYWLECLINEKLYLRCARSYSITDDSIAWIIKKDLGIVALHHRHGNTHTIDLSGYNLVTDVGFKRLVQESPNVAHVNFLGCNQLTSAALLNLAFMCPALQFLENIPVMLMNDSVLTALGNCCPALRHISLSFYDLNYQFLNSCSTTSTTIVVNSEVTDVGIHNLASSECKSTLEYLDLSFCSSLTDLSMFSIGQNCSALKTLVLNHCRRISDKGLTVVTRGCHRLEHLNLNYCNNITNYGIASSTRIVMPH
jgi:hypothetical protein